MATDLNSVIRFILYALLLLSLCTIIFLTVPFLRRIRNEKKAATAKLIAQWLAGVTAVGTFCITALNVKAPIGILPEGDPALKAIITYYGLIQGRRCEEAWRMIHPARQDTLAKEFRGFGGKEFCAAYRTTKTYENLQITRQQDIVGIEGSKVYRVSYDVKDEFPNNRYFFEVRTKTVGDVLRTESVNEKEVFKAVVTNMRRYYDVPNDVLPQLHEIVNNMPVGFIFAPELISEVTRLIKLNYGVELKEKEARPSRQEVKRHYVHNLVMSEDQGIWKIRDGLSFPDLVAPYVRMEKPL